MRKVLQICHRIPFPPADGGSIAMHQITRGLLDRGYEVKVLAMAPSQLRSNADDISLDYIRETGFESVSIDTRIHLIPAFLNLFSRKSYNIERFRSRQMNEKLTHLLKNQSYDIIQLEGLYLTPYIPLIRKLSKSPILFRAHNIEHFIWQRLAQTATHPLKKIYLRLLASRLKNYETQIIQKVDGLIAISELDKQFFTDIGYSGPGTVIPAGMPDIVLPEPLPEMEVNSLFHLGSMDWRPNQEGVNWFVKKVWPLVIRERSDVKLYLAGKRMSDHYYQLSNDQITVAGEVDNAIEFILSKNLMIVPLLSGGGMRVKIIEGMAAGKTIISTSIGAEGIGCKHLQHIYIADSAESMAAWIWHALDHPDEARAMGMRAREFATQHFSMPHIIDKLLAFYNGFYS